MISHRCMRCRAYAMGWCEYDPITDTVYPMDEEICTEREGTNDGNGRKTEENAKEVRSNAKAVCRRGRGCKAVSSAVGSG